MGCPTARLSQYPVRRYNLNSYGGFMSDEFVNAEGEMQLIAQQSESNELADLIVEDLAEPNEEIAFLALRC